MTTETIGIKDFRANVNKYAQLARKGKKRYIVTNHNKPLFEVTPVKESIYTDEFIQDMETALKEYKRGDYITHEQLVKELGLPHKQ